MQLLYSIIFIVALGFVGITLYAAFVTTTYQSKFHQSIIAVALLILGAALLIPLYWWLGLGAAVATGLL